jgi:hypothetical protein
MFTPGDKVKLTLKARRKLCQELRLYPIGKRYCSRRFGVGVFVRLNKFDPRYAIVDIGGNCDCIEVVDLELAKQ